jgi:hypothetical protein
MDRQISGAATLVGGTALLLFVALTQACHRAPPPKPDHRLSPYVRTIDVPPVPVAGRAP